jgi:hypothetical protein
MTAAGLDPSRIHERAVLLAKVQGSKRKRTEEMDMDMDDGEGDGADEGDWMDVDGEDQPNKRAKGNAGRAVAVNSRAPRTNRQLAGMRDQSVCLTFFARRSLTHFFTSKHPGPSNCVILARDYATCSQKPARVIALSELRWCVVPFFSSDLA